MPTDAVKHGTSLLQRSGEALARLLPVRQTAGGDARSATARRLQGRPNVECQVTGDYRRHRTTRLAGHRRRSRIEAKAAARLACCRTRRPGVARSTARAALGRGEGRGAAPWWPAA